MSKGVVTPLDRCIHKRRWEDNLCVSIFGVHFWIAIIKGFVGTVFSVLNDGIILLGLLQLWKGNGKVWKICRMIDEWICWMISSGFKDMGLFAVDCFFSCSAVAGKLVCVFDGGI